MSLYCRVLPAAVAAAFLLLGPSAAFADRNDGEKQRREKWDGRDRDRAYRYGSGGWGRWPGTAESEREWRKDRREAEREWREDRREAEREWDKDRREAAREARRNRRDRDHRYPRTNRLPYPIP